MRFEHCPSCGEPVELTHYPGGFVVAACRACEGRWEIHGDIVRRMADSEFEEAVSATADASAPTSTYTSGRSVPMHVAEGSPTKGATQ